MNRINRISVQTQPDGSIDITVPASMAEEFKLMVRKGTNTSPNKHQEITDFLDRLHDQAHIMGQCMKWDIPAEDKYELAVIKEYKQLTPEQQQQFKSFLGITNSGN